MLNTLVSPEFLINTLFGSGLLAIAFKSTLVIGQVAQKIDTLEKQVNKIEQKYDSAFLYLNARIDTLTNQLTKATTRQ